MWMIASVDLVVTALPMPPLPNIAAALPAVGHNRAVLRLIAICLAGALSGCTSGDRGAAFPPVTVSEGVTAEACGASVCLQSEVGRLRLDQVGTDLAPLDASVLLGEQAGEYLFAVYDRKGRVHTVSWDAKDGNITWPEATSGEWKGRLYVIRSTIDTLGVVTVFPQEGINNSEGKNFLPNEAKAAAMTP